MSITVLLNPSNQEDYATPVLENSLSTTASHVAVNVDDSLNAAEGASHNDVAVGCRQTTSYVVLLNSSVNSELSTSRGQCIGGLIAYVGCILFVLVVYAVLRLIPAWVA